MKTPFETANKVVRLFEGRIIGSYLLVGLIEGHLINDIDIAITESNLFKVQEYLNDLGFFEDKPSRRDKYGNIWKSDLQFKKEGYKPIHICVDGNKLREPWDKYELLKVKLKRFNDSDRAQIQSFLDMNPVEVDE